MVEAADNYSLRTRHLQSSTVDKLHVDSFRTRHMAGESYFACWTRPEHPQPVHFIVVIAVLITAKRTGRVIDCSFHQFSLSPSWLAIGSSIAILVSNVTS